jgi:hypothetical protein
MTMGTRGREERGVVFTPLNLCEFINSAPKYGMGFGSIPHRAWGQRRGAGERARGEI